MDQEVRVSSGLNILLSLWLIASPFVLNYTGWNRFIVWNPVVIGVVVLILASIRAVRPEKASWLSWVNVLLGLWLILTPFILGPSDFGGAIRTDVLVGIGLMVFGAWSALTSARAAA